MKQDQPHLRGYRRRSRVVGPRARSTSRVASRVSDQPLEHVRTIDGVVVLARVRYRQNEARAACARRMTIAVAAHEALHAEHSRQAREAQLALDELEREAEQMSPDDLGHVTNAPVIRATTRDRNAAQRELAKLDAHPPATPLRPRPAAASYEAPRVTVGSANAQRGGTSPRRARNARHAAQIEREHPRSRAAFNRACSTSTACLAAAEARSAARGAQYDAAQAQNVVP